MHNVWNNFIYGGGKWPQGGVMVHGEDDTIEIGSSVMTWPNAASSVPTSIEDCTCNNAKYIGKIVRVIS
jgi:hypothetical protein